MRREGIDLWMNLDELRFRRGRRRRKGRPAGTSMRRSDFPALAWDGQCQRFVFICVAFDSGGWILLNNVD